MLRLSIDVAAAAILALLLGTPLIADEGCFARKLIPSPASVSSGVFLDNGETLLLADHASQTLFPFRMDGRARGSLPPGLVSALKNLPPQSIAQQGDDLLVAVPRSRILTLGTGFFIKAAETVVTDQVKGRSEGLTLYGMYRWQPVGSDLIAFSDIETNNKRPDSAFVRFPARDPAAFEIIHSIGFSAPSKVFYQLGFPYIASLGADGFILSMKNPIEIYRSRKGANPWEPLAADAVPEGFSLAPDIPNTFTSKEDITLVMGVVEKSKMPVGLYGWNGFLYMLTREPEGQGTRWMLFKIDPRREEVVGSTLLPTRAAHLTVIPGAKRWAFIEKGRMEGWNLQRVDSMFLVPSGRLKDRLPAVLCRPGELRK